MKEESVSTYNDCCIFSFSLLFVEKLDLFLQKNFNYGTSKYNKK